MRRRLLLVVLATAGMVVVAFAVPLAMLVRSVAEDRAMSAAQRDAAALAPVLALTDDPDALRPALDRTSAGDEGRLAVWLPDGTVLGDPHDADPDAVELAQRAQVSFSQPTDDGRDIYIPVVLGDGGVAVIRAQVTTALLRDGVTYAWTALAVVAVALLVGAGVVADRLARRLVHDATDLAATARALAAGEATARAAASDTPELGEAGHALNLLADRIDELRAAERERVADLSHRLRTPLTSLRLDAERTGAAEVVAGVDRLESAVTELVRSARRPLHDAPVSVPVDLAALVRARAEFWSALAEDDDRMWSLAVPDGIVPVGGDADDLGAAIDAVLGNIHTHTASGTGYRIALTIDSGQARLQIDDDGPGITDPELARGRGVSGRESSGLGLDIATSAAAAAGGALHLERAPGGGTRVVLALPLVS